ncbi:hypothetical protein [Crocosphaera sp. Alani8]|uniref:hypothetical protein n=1 Tax=Crocosphaera sp. Alani8 TaxID=3038952 RepID=UPI00313F318D
MSQQSSETSPSFKLVKRFFAGASVGIFLALLYWSYSIFAHSNPSIVQGIIGIAVSSITAGLIASFTSVEKLMDSLPWI